MRMTLFVDASLDARCGSAGWGSWAITDAWGKGRFQGGPIVIPGFHITSSNTAEIAGIALALWEHRNKGDLANLTGVMIQCDNLPALGYIKRKLPRTRVSGTKNEQIRSSGTWQSPVVGMIMDTIADVLQGLAVEVRHVKGHRSPSLDGRSWVNNQCDAEARRHMEALRNGLAIRDQMQEYHRAKKQGTSR